MKLTIQEPYIQDTEILNRLHIAQLSGDLTIIGNVGDSYTFEINYFGKASLQLFYDKYIEFGNQGIEINKLICGVLLAADSKLPDIILTQDKTMWSDLCDEVLTKDTKNVYVINPSDTYLVWEDLLKLIETYGIDNILCGKELGEIK